GGLPLVEGVSFSLHAGDKVGLVGRNGAGKTTLLKVLAGEEQPARGAILRRGRLGYLRQDPRSRLQDPGLTAIAHVLDGRGVAEATARLEKLLASYRGVLMVVSHDIMLLDRSITRVLHLDEGTLVEYKGTYSQYREARRQDEARLAKMAARQTAEIKRLSSLADSMRHSTEK